MPPTPSSEQSSILSAPALPRSGYTRVFPIYCSPLELESPGAPGSIFVSAALGLNGKCGNAFAHATAAPATVVSPALRARYLPGKSNDGAEGFVKGCPAWLCSFFASSAPFMLAYRFSISPDDRTMLPKATAMIDVSSHTLMVKPRVETVR